MTLYHYCRRDPQPTSSLDLVRSFLAQCLHAVDADAISSLWTTFREQQVLTNNDSQTEDKLWKILRKIIDQSQSKIYFVIDGVDEIRSNASPLRRILSLLNNSESDRGTSLLLSSRFDCDIVEAIEALGNVDFFEVNITKELVHQDLFEFVAFQINNKHSALRRKPQSTRDDIIKKVCDQADGSFLYATLVLNELQGEKISSPAAISNTLKNLPSGLFDVYRHHLESLGTLKWEKKPFSGYIALLGH